MPPPGWLFDDATGQTRWWNGREWTDHTRPLDPVVRTGGVNSAARQTGYPETPTGRNAPATAALVFLLLALIGVGGLIWLVAGRDPFVALIVTLVDIAMVLAAFGLSIAGLVIAIRRPTRKLGSIFALVLSTLLIAFFVFRVLTLASTVDAARLEDDITVWMQAQTGELAVVACPDEPPSAVGSIFSCTVTTATSSMQVDVTVQDGGTVSWVAAP